MFSGVLLVEGWCRDAMRRRGVVCCFAWLTGVFILLVLLDIFYAIRRRQYPKRSWQTGSFTDAFVRTITELRFDAFCFVSLTVQYGSLSCGGGKVIR
jgi:hypothetical protein